MKTDGLWRSRRAPNFGLALLAAMALGAGPALLTAVPASAGSTGVPLAVPLTFTVNSTADPGDGICNAAECTLREAMTAANANDPGAGNANSISFAIPGAGVKTIRPTSPLPDITRPVVIDGYTQPGTVRNTLVTGTNATLLIEIDGSGVGVDSNALLFRTGNSAVRGLVINRFGFRAIILLDGPGTGGSTIQGNYIGLNAAGTAALPNLRGGISVGSTGNTIGGPTPALRNVIAGGAEPARYAIDVSNPSVPGTTIQGNYIGTNAAGTAGLGVGGGIDINAGVGTTVGGPSLGEGNLISGNLGDGISVGNITPAMAGATIQGNRIGTNAAGTAALGNGDRGIFISAANTTVGGTAPLARNVIAASGATGVHIQNPGTVGNVVQGNYIGTLADGTTAAGNGSDGVYVAFSATNNAIGGTAAGAGNVIAFNNGNGVRIGDSLTDPATGNAILSNSIHDNVGLGIDLGGDGRTTNDAQDADTGPNNLQNAPVLTSATTAGGTTTVLGTFNSAPNTVYRLQFFSSPAADPSGFGEGQTLLTTLTITTDASGNAALTVPLTPPVAIGQIVTATATDPQSNTSEFSNAVPNQAPTTPTATATATGTATPVPPTATATAVPPTATSTATTIPPTATGTATAVPPTVTATPLPPTATATPVVPEWSPLWLFGSGALALAGLRLRRRRR